MAWRDGRTKIAVEIGHADTHAPDWEGGLVERANERHEELRAQVDGARGDGVVRRNGDNCHRVVV